MAQPPGSPGPDEARIAVFRQFVAQKPDDPFPRYSLAMAYRGAGRLDEAIAEFEQIVSRHPDYVPAYLMAGQTLEQAGRREDAARIYEQGIGAASRAGNDHARSELAAARDLLA